MFFLDVWDEIGRAIVDSLRSLMLSLCDVIYGLIIFFYDIFITIGNADIFNISSVQEIYSRIGMLLGLFMVFRVTFSMIQYVINPELISDKKQGMFNIVKKIIIVIVLLGTTPSLFRMAYKLQNVILESNVIAKVITGKNIDTGAAGADLAWYTFNSFYKWNDGALRVESDKEKDANELKADKCPELLEINGQPSIIHRFLVYNNSLDFAFNCVNARIDVNYAGRESQQDYIIDFSGNGFLAVVVGGLVLWMIVMYCIQVGIRLVQLAYLQLVAPIPIIMYLDPKSDETLNKWFKQCMTTYLDFFMRVAIIYLVIFLTQLIINTDFSNVFGNVDSGIDSTMITIVMILALLIFANRAPKLINELFPLSGGAAALSFGLDPKKEVWDPAMKTVKSLYNTPLGWAPKVLGWAGKSAITAHDRKKYGLPKPRNKIQQWYDKLTPGRAEEIKNRQKARIDQKDFEQRLDFGHKIKDKYEVDGKLTDKAFKHQEYKDSFNEVNVAKGKVKTAKNILNGEQAEYNKLLYQNLSIFDGNNDEERKLNREKALAVARQRVKNAEGNLDVANSRLELAKEKHQKNQKIYTADYEKETAYKQYTDTHMKTKDITDGVNEVIEKVEAKYGENSSGVHDIPSSEVTSDNSDSFAEESSSPVDNPEPVLGATTPDNKDDVIYIPEEQSVHNDSRFVQEEKKKNEQSVFEELKKEELEAQKKEMELLNKVNNTYIDEVSNLFNRNENDKIKGVVSIETVNKNVEEIKHLNDVLSNLIKEKANIRDMKDLNEIETEIAKVKSRLNDLNK